MLLLLFFFLAHTNFQEIVVPEDVTLVEDFKDEFDEYYDDIKAKFFGWSTVVIHEEEEVVFVSETLFSYSNQSNESIDYTYKYQKGKDLKNSVAFTGDIQTKAGGKVKGFNLNFNSKLQSKLELAVKETTDEVWDVDIEIKPYKKVSLKVKGQGELTNGVSKYYIFWIPVKKGGWEILEITEEYFWLVEEHA